MQNHIHDGDAIGKGLLLLTDERVLLERLNVFLGLSPWLTQTVKTLFGVRCEFLDRQDHFIAI